MEKIFISNDVPAIVSSSSKGDQTKWLIGNRWVKESTRGYEGITEYVAYLILQSSTLSETSYIAYTPCYIEKDDGSIRDGCFSIDFRGKFQEVTLERLFEANFETTDEILNNHRYSTYDKFKSIIEKIHNFTDLNVSHEISTMLAFDAFILNEDRHTNNILFLFDPTKNTWQLAPIFDNGLSLLSDTKDYPIDKPLNTLKIKVKAKPFNSSFNKQLSLYDGEPFIDRTALIDSLDSVPYELSRAKKVVHSQLREPSLQRILFN